MRQPLSETRNSSLHTTADSKSRSTLLKFFLIVLPFWVSAKMFSGPYQEMVRNYLSAVVLPVLLGISIQLLFPRLEEKRLLVGVFLFLALVETLQHFFPGLFVGMVFTLAGFTLVGSAYSINMIPYYGVGGFIGYFILKSCRQKTK